ncbi:hypothetical protein Zmor_026906 [Zophobas morio]|uniref:Odorant receptor n=1 Tax=Zophobas morio TaxID=2755281 RepID=A0AA38HUY6_9CUCU|nr:hypothetical protein Zmor_026906 [Zophobas morio]
MNNSFKDKIKIAAVTRKILQYSLLWPKDGTELNPGVEYKLKVFGFFLITGTMSLLNTIHFLLVIKNKEGLDIEEVAVIIATYGTYYMVCAYINNQHNLALLLHDLSDFKKFGRPPGFDKKNKQLNFYSQLIVLYSLLAVGFYAYMRYLDRDTCRASHAAKKTNGNFCGLITPLWIPVKTDYFPVFQLLFIYVFIAVHMLVKMGMPISFSALEIAHHIILRINHLKDMIIECLKNKNDEERSAKLKICILYHNEILNLTARLDKTFYHCMFGHFALTGAICAVLEKQIVDGYNVYAGVVHFAGWILALLLGCVGGQHLLDASEVIPGAIWSSNWYMMPAKVQKDVLFMLVNSQNKFFIRTGPFGILCLPLFVSVLKASYSILCML